LFQIILNRKYIGEYTEFRNRVMDGAGTDSTSNYRMASMLTLMTGNSEV